MQKVTDVLDVVVEKAGTAVAWLLDSVGESWNASNRSRARTKLKSLALEGVTLQASVDRLRKEAQKAEAAAVSRENGYRNARKQLPGIRKNTSIFERRLQENRRAQDHLYKLLHGKVDEDPEPASRTISESLADFFGNLTKNAAERHDHSLRCFEEILEAQIEDVEAARQQALARGTVNKKEYFSLDRELVQLKAQLYKTRERRRTITKAPVAA